VYTGVKLRWIGIAALPFMLGCQRCSGSAGDAATPSASASAPITQGDTPAPPADARSLDAAEADVPEIKDTGLGRATAALRAILEARGIPFDAASIERECKVDDDGASIDDIEDVAVKYGLEAGQIILPAEHVLLAEPSVLPAIVVVDGPDDTQDFVLAFRFDGDRVQIMSPISGRSWVPRADLQKTLHVHEMIMPAADLRAAMGSPTFREALEARMLALGAARPDAEALLVRAAADPSYRGLGALDAAIRQLEAGPGKGAGTLAAAFGCAFEDHCEGVSPIPAALWSAQTAPNDRGGEAQVKVRGVVILAFAGEQAP
jgi:Peptidase C39 family